MVLLPVTGLTSFHVDPKHPNHKPDLVFQSRHWTVFVDGREIQCCTGFDIANGFATYFPKDSAGFFLPDIRVGKTPRVRTARAKGVVTVFMIGKET